MTPTNCPTTELRVEGAIAFSTRRCCSDPDSPYDGFNACDYTGGEPSQIAEFRAQATRRLGLADPSLLIMPRQTHTANVATVSRSDCGCLLPDIDALVTSDPDIAIGVSTADCVPLVMCDSSAGVLAVVHSGWRGTYAGIAAHAVEAMEVLGASVEDISVAFGPFIHMESYEVSHDCCLEI